MMSRFQFCPKCQGKVHINRDEYGWYVECITCGYTHDLKKVVIRKKNINEETLPPAIPSPRH